MPRSSHLHPKTRDSPQAQPDRHATSLFLTEENLDSKSDTEKVPIMEQTVGYVVRVPLNNSEVPWVNIALNLPEARVYHAGRSNNSRMDKRN